jgi:hypothetical protein
VAALLATFAAGCATHPSTRETTQSTPGGGTGLQRLKSVSVSGLYIYDARRLNSVVVTPSDVVRSSIHVARGSGHPALAGQFTRIGASKFCRLTLALAQRGRRLHRPQHFVVQVNGAVYARPYLDYRAFPSGLCGTPGFEVVGTDPALVAKLARKLRGS